MEYWHVMNRGVEKRSIAMSDADRIRFVSDLHTLNNSKRVENSSYFYSRDAEYDPKERDRLVTIHAWCLMGNHYHLLLSEQVDSGVSRFLQKFNIGYTMYFNEKHDRSGVLFQGKTKRVLIENDRQFLYILPYIHLNPLDFMKGSADWRAQSLAHPKAALKWVSEYRWSSYRNYAGEKEFAEVLEGSELFAVRKTHTQELDRFLRNVPDTTHTKLNLE